MPLLRCRQTPCCRISQKHNPCLWSIAPWWMGWNYMWQILIKPPWSVQTDQRRAAGHFRPHWCTLRHTPCSWLDWIGQTPVERTFSYSSNQRWRCIEQHRPHHSQAPSHHRRPHFRPPSLTEASWSPSWSWCSCKLSNLESLFRTIK